MHGVKKVIYTLDQEEVRKRERAKKQKVFTELKDAIFALHKDGNLGDDLLTKTEQLLSTNPDFYSLWNWRRRVLLRMEADQQDKDKELESSGVVDAESDKDTMLRSAFEKELNLTANCLMNANPKSYGAWHHRAWVLGRMSSPNLEAELALCSKALKEDERNFHCWDHRRLVCRLASTSPQSELEFSDKKVLENFSNYSNWHYRSILLPDLYPPEAGSDLPVQREKLLDELKLVQNAFYTDPDDSSSWFYRQWLTTPRIHSATAGDWKETDGVVAASATTLNVLTFVDHKEYLLIVFDQPVALVKDGSEILYNGKLTTDWTSAGSCSMVWWSWKDAEAPKSAASQICILTRQENGELAEAATCAGPVYRPFVPAKAAGFLREPMVSEIDNCRQLIQLEPNSKWPLLTLVNCLILFDRHGYEEEILQLFEKLATVDPNRKNYYRDTCSKFLIESAVAGIPEKADNLEMTDLDLTTLTHVSYYCHISFLDISGNQLHNLRPLAVCIGLEMLCCADNPQLCDCGGLEGLKLLNMIDFSACGFTSADQLAPLKACQALKSVKLVDTAVAKPGEIDKVKSEMLPDVHLVFHDYE